MKLITSFIHYQPWAGAINTYAIIDYHNKLEDLDTLITECYPDGLTQTQLNDILWFDSEWVLRNLGIEDNDDDELEEDERYILQQL